MIAWMTRLQFNRMNVTILKQEADEVSVAVWAEERTSVTEAVIPAPP